MVLAKAGDQMGVVVAAYENPMLRNLQIELARYPEIQRGLTTGRPVLVEDVSTDPLYADERVRWQRDGRSEEHTSELQSRLHLVCRLLLEKKKKRSYTALWTYVSRPR